MSQVAENEIVVENAGPIEGQFRISLPDFGLYELRGSKGVGKSTVLNCVSMLAGHRVSMTVHDGELAGSIEGFGRVVPLGSRKKPKGDCAVDMLDTERFDLVDLIDPAGKTPEVRDATRIKALATLCDLELRPNDFYVMMGGQENFDELGVTPTEDPVLYTSRIKAAIDGTAKAMETQAATERGHAESHQQRADGVDVKAESDSSVLNKAVEDAVAKVQAHAHKLQTYDSAEATAKEAEAKLVEARDGYKGPTVEEAEKEYDLRGKELAANRDTVAAREEEYAKAKANLEAAKAAENRCEDAVLHAETACRGAQQQQKLEAGWTASIKKFMSQEKPSSEEVEAANKELGQARSDQENGVLIREAQAAQQQAKAHLARAKTHDKEAKILREMSSEAFGVLTDKLHTEHITIKSIDGKPRLVVKHPSRGNCFFDQLNGLSDGERVRTTIDELLPHLESPGALEIPQRTYQDLPPADRLELAAYALEHRFYLFGGQVTDGPLEVVQITPDSLA